MSDFILEKTACLKPKKLLDVCCGCGSFTALLADCCKNVTAVDNSSALIERCKKENSRPEITYICMDGGKIDFPSGSFDLVIGRGLLHHTDSWENVLDEMMRVSSRYIMVGEPVDDFRSEEKKNTFYGHKIFSELQNDANYIHKEHMKPEVIVDYFLRKGLLIEQKLIKSDEPIEFDEYFRDYPRFLEKSSRPSYFINKLEGFRKSLKGKKLLSECDTFFILGTKTSDNNTCLIQKK